MVMPQLITEAIQNEDFVRNLADMLSPQVTMRWTADLMEHMTRRSCRRSWLGSCRPIQVP